MRLLHPRRAARKCSDCIKYIYNDDETRLDRPFGSGRWIERNPGDMPPCGDCPKIPKGDKPHPSNAQDLSERNLKAFSYWLECDSVNWVNCYVDPIVKRNSSIIKQIYDESRLRPMAELAALIPLMAGRNGR